MQAGVLHCQLSEQSVPKGSCPRSHRKYNFSQIELLLVTAFKFGLDLAWYFPSWVFIFVIAQTLAFSGLLKELGVCDLVNNYVKIAQEQIQKVIGMIPRYQPVN